MSVWKKRIRLGLMMTALLTLAWGLALAALSYPFLSTTTDSVRLRKSASKTAMVMDTVPSGAQVEVLEKTGSFFRVRYNGQTGYVAAEYVRTEKDAITAVTPEPMETVSSYPYSTITREKVNLREGKSVRSTLLKKIPAGANIVVRASSGTWVMSGRLCSVSHLLTAWEDTLTRSARASWVQPRSNRSRRITLPMDSFAFILRPPSAFRVQYSTGGRQKPPTRKKGKLN